MGNTPKMIWNGMLAIIALLFIFGLLFFIFDAKFLGKMIAISFVLWLIWRYVLTKEKKPKINKKD